MSESINDIDRGAYTRNGRRFLAFVPCRCKTNPQIGKESILRFDERIQSTAALTQPQQAALFLKTVDEERDILFDEYQRDPEVLKKRLGLTPSVAPALIIHPPQTLQEVVARTAVRATVWESIFALFRLFR
jgi:hypothetical protein